MITGFVHAYTGRSEVQGFTADCIAQIINNRHIPAPTLLPLLLHEFAHQHVLGSYVGQAIRAVAYQALEIFLLLESANLHSSIHRDEVLMAVRFQAVCDTFCLISEGLAHFAQFDLFPPPDAETACAPIFLASKLLFGHKVSLIELEKILSEARTSDELINEKTDLLYRPWLPTEYRYPETCNTAGYVLVKDLYARALAMERPCRSNDFYTFIYEYFFNDPVLAKLTVQIGSDLGKDVSEISTYLGRRYRQIQSSDISLHVDRYRVHREQTRKDHVSFPSFHKSEVELFGNDRRLSGENLRRMIDDIYCGASPTSAVIRLRGSEEVIGFRRVIVLDKSKPADITILGNSENLANLRCDFELRRKQTLVGLNHGVSFFNIVYDRSAYVKFEARFTGGVVARFALKAEECGDMERKGGLAAEYLNLDLGNRLQEFIGSEYVGRFWFKLSHCGAIIFAFLSEWRIDNNSLVEDSTVQVVLGGKGLDEASFIEELKSFDELVRHEEMLSVLIGAKVIGLAFGLGRELRVRCRRNLVRKTDRLLRRTKLASRIESSIDPYSSGMFGVGLEARRLASAVSEQTLRFGNRKGVNVRSRPSRSYATKHKEKMDCYFSEKGHPLV